MESDNVKQMKHWNNVDWNENANENEMKMWNNGNVMRVLMND